MSNIWTFNIADGYPEAVLRGFRQSLLTTEDYRRLGLSDTLDDLRTALEDTDYGNFLQDEVSPLAVTVIGAKCRAKLAADFRHLQTIASKPLSTFLDFVAAEKMIDNVVNLIQGAANRKSPEELLARIDPLGYFPELRAIASLDLSTGYADLYRMLLLDTPVGPYFEAYMKARSQFDYGIQNQEINTIFTDQDMELMRSALKKQWLEDFYEFCVNLGGSTAQIMNHILKCEADFRVLSVTLNTINTPLGSSSRLQDRNSLYPYFGYLYPDGIDKIRKAWNDVTVRAALESFPDYLALYDQCKGYYVKDTPFVASQQNSAQQSQNKKNTNVDVNTPLENLLFAKYVEFCEMTFEEQFHYGIFYAWVKLKEQEIRNIVWIADMILMKRKDQIDRIIPIFKSRI